VRSAGKHLTYAAAILIQMKISAKRQKTQRRRESQENSSPTRLISVLKHAQGRRGGAVGPAAEILRQSGQFVAGFIGSPKMNFFWGVVEKCLQGALRNSSAGFRKCENPDSAAQNQCGRRD
jgi:hypothetical protein